MLSTHTAAAVTLKLQGKISEEHVLTHTLQAAVWHTWWQWEGKVLSVSQFASIRRAFNLNLHCHRFVLELTSVQEKYSCRKHDSPSRVATISAEEQSKHSQKASQQDFATIIFCKVKVLDRARALGCWLRQFREQQTGTSRAPLTWVVDASAP